MYGTKEQDHQKRRDQEGSYSLYNYLYHYLLDNFEPSSIPEGTEDLLVKEGIAYNRKGGKQMTDEEVRKDAKKAVTNFKVNDGKRGDTAHNFGKKQANSYETISSSLADLRW